MFSKEVSGRLKNPHYRWFASMEVRLYGNVVWEYGNVIKSRQSNLKIISENWIIPS